MALMLGACTFDKNPEAIKSTGTFNDKSEIEILRFPENGEDTLKTSYFADTVLYVPLETNINSFIKSLEQVWMNDSIIIINDRFKLLMFSCKGKFLKQIGNRGKGPGEHGLIFNFDVIQDTIYVTSSGKKSWIKYALNGTFCKEIPFKISPLQFSSTLNGELTRYHREYGKIYIHGKDMNVTDTIVVEHGVTIGRFKYGINNNFLVYFQKTSSGLLFNNYLSDTIWNISHGKKKPAFILGLGMKDKLLPRDKHIEFSKGDYKRWEKTAKRYQMVHLVPFPSRMFVFQKYWCEESYSSIYIQNVQTKEIKKYNTSYIYEDIVGCLELSKFIFSNSLDYLIGKITPLELQDFLRSNKEKASPQWLDQMKNVDKNDNPILVLIKIKQSP